MHVFKNLHYGSSTRYASSYEFALRVDLSDCVERGGAFKTNFDNKNNIEVSDLADQLENEEQAEIDNNHLSVPLSPGSSDTKSPTAAGSKKAPISRTMGVTSNLKQAEKNRL